MLKKQWIYQKVIIYLIMRVNENLLEVVIKKGAIG